MMDRKKLVGLARRAALLGSAVLCLGFSAPAQADALAAKAALDAGDFVAAYHELLPLGRGARRGGGGRALFPRSL